MKKNNTTNIKSLVDDLFVPLSKQPSVLYCKLMDLKWLMKKHYSPISQENASASENAIFHARIQVHKVIDPIVYKTTNQFSFKNAF